LREGIYKYVRPLNDDLEELYDLEADPEELVNLAEKPEYQGLLERMRATTIKELRKDGGGLRRCYAPNSHYEMTRRL